MDVHVYEKQGDRKHVYVSGEIDTSDDVQKLIGLMTDTKHFPGGLNITFLNAGIVDSRIIEHLVLLQKNKNCRVYTLNRYLYSYLYHLGICCEFVIVKPPKNNDDSKLITNRLTLNPAQVKDLLKEIHRVYGYDYSQYQLESIMRRIKIAMVRERFEDFNIFSEYILKNRYGFEQLFLDFSINTTEFFRDPEVYAAIKEKIIPQLKTFAHIRIWCVGCSTGKEPYSLAILLHECGILYKTRIYATDINPYVIEEAKNGLYSMETLDKDISNYRNAKGEGSFTDYFELKGRYMKVKDFLKENILFFQHSIVNSGVLHEFQLILCRNVLIYFNAGLQQQALKLVHESLDISGFLVLGKSEGILNNNGHCYFRKYLQHEKIYKRISL